MKGLKIRVINESASRVGNLSEWEIWLDDEKLFGSATGVGFFDPKRAEEDAVRRLSAIGFEDVDVEIKERKP